MLFDFFSLDSICLGVFSGEEWIFVTGKLRGVEGGPKLIVRINKTTSKMF